MEIEKCCIGDIFKYIDLQEKDVILYLGGRIDDDNLYPPGYRKYLKAKIKRLKPTKIICHNHWYAKKYYEKEILTKHTKIDMVLVHYGHFEAGNFTSINPEEYVDHLTYLKILIDKNPSMVYAMYTCGYIPSDWSAAVDVDNGRFGGDYDLNNVKYFTFDRTYAPRDLTEEDLGHGTSRIATDGFAMITSLVEAGFKNLNILGFSAFGSDEDQSYHTEFGAGKYAGRKYFNLGTSECQLAEADILQSWVQTKKIKNVEDYSKLMYYLKDE